MRETVGPQVKVKAARGVRTLDALLAVIEAGAERWRAHFSGWSRAVWHLADRVSDSEIGGVRKLKGGIGDVSPTTGVDLS